MHSPLPDSSALEAGIIEDVRPSRLSRVQDNVRNLLRSSMLGSVQSSPRITHTIPSPHHTPTHASIWHRAIPEPVPSPSTESVSSVDSELSCSSNDSNSTKRSTTMLMPSTSYQHAVRHMAQHSAMFNTRAVTALNHPDLSDPFLATIIQNDAKKRQKHAWKRSKHRHSQGSRAACQWLLCTILGLALAGLVATYVALATTMNNVSTVFHILFVLGILLISIAFIHTLARLWLVAEDLCHNRKHSKPRRRHRPAQPQAPPRTSDGDDEFVPHMPITVLIGDDNVRLDPNEAHPSSAVHQPPEVWVKDGTSKAPVPPPAYGRWRGSVRVDPGLLHWQTIPTPQDHNVPDVPSPTYEATPFSDAGSPPSYKTRETPPRAKQQPQHTQEHAQTQTAEPEMVEGRGIGL